MSTKWFDLSGRLSLSVSGAGAGVLTSVLRHLDPFEADDASTGGPADITVEFDGAARRPAVDLHNPARDGLTTAFDGEALALLAGEHACELRPSEDGARLTLRSHPAFPIGTLFRTLVRPALHAAALRHDVAAVHSAAVEVDGRAVLVAGWSESGKTETALALMENGAAWLTDKWTLVGADGEASAFPINVGVRRWVLPYLPRLAGSLPRAARTQVAVAGAVAAATRPLRRRRSHGGAVGAAAVAAERAVGVADRAALTQNEIRAAYGQHDDAARRVPLGTVALLTTVPGSEVRVEDADVSWAATRLAVTGAYERHDWYMLHDRRRYATASSDGDPRGQAVAAERRILERALGGVRVLQVRAPFPVDPRRVADALGEAM